MRPLIPEPADNRKSLLERLEDSLLPLINLVFLLLMFFIFAGQLADTPLPDLPGVSGAGDNNRPDADLVLTRDGDWRVNARDIARKDLLAALPAPDASRPLRIAAAGSSAMDRLEELLSVLEQGGYTEVILLTEPAP